MPATQGLCRAAQFAAVSTVVTTGVTPAEPARVRIKAFAPSPFRTGSVPRHGGRPRDQRCTKPGCCRSGGAARY